MKKEQEQKLLAKAVKIVIKDIDDGKVLDHDELLSDIDMTATEIFGDEYFEYCEDIFEAVIDSGYGICDLCGRIFKDENRVDVGNDTPLRRAIIDMNRAGEVNYLRDDIIGVEVICKSCEHECLIYEPKYKWGGCVYASEADIEADKKKLEDFKASGQAELWDLPRPLILDLKQRELDNEYMEERDENASLAEMMCAEYLMSDGRLEERVANTCFVLDDFNTSIE